MRTTFTLPVGADKIGMQLPDGSGPTALIVDNPSGYWLTVYPGDRTVPPYTQGWVHSYGTPVPSVDVRATLTAPASQVSTGAGDPVTVTLTDEDDDPGANDGAPFIAGFTPATAVTMGITGVIAVPSGPQTSTLISCPAGHRIRITSVNATLDGTTYPGTDYGTIGHLWLLDDAVDLPLVQLDLVPGTPPAVIPFPSGLDVTKGGDVSIRYWSDWANVGIAGTVVYQVI